MDRETVEEIKRHFGVVAEDLRGEVRLVAEGVDILSQHVDGLTQRVDGLTDRVDGLTQRFDRFEQEVRHEFAETQAMIRLSYSELDKRLPDVETDVVQLRARLDRLEARG